jgi:hypothetical protein
MISNTKENNNNIKMRLTLLPQSEPKRHRWSRGSVLPLSRHDFSGRKAFGSAFALYILSISKKTMISNTKD